MNDIHEFDNRRHLHKHMSGVRLLAHYNIGWVVLDDKFCNCTLVACNDIDHVLYTSRVLTSTIVEGLF